jgi:hypothetical protein
VYPAWIGTTDIPYQFTEVPGPLSANHMIAVYINKKDTFFLDATGKHHPFKFQTSMIQGKEAMVGMGKDKFVIAKVPHVREDVNHDKDSIILTLSKENKLKGKGFYTLTGYEKIRVLSTLEKKSYVQQKNYLRDVLEKGNNKFTLDTFYIVSKADDPKLTLVYTFAINDYLSEAENMKFINLNFLKNYFDRLGTAGRKYPLSFRYSSTSSIHVRLLLGDNYKVDNLPSNANGKSKLLDFEQKYEVNGSIIDFNNKIDFKGSLIEPENFAEWDKVIELYKKTKPNAVSLTLKKP